MSSDAYSSLGQDARRELYLWAIFVGRFELGKYLCSKTWVRLSHSKYLSFYLESSRIESVGCCSNWCANLSLSSSNRSTFGNETGI